MHKMKLLQLGKYWDFKGGIETQFRNLCNNLTGKVNLKIVHSSTNSKTKIFGNRYSVASYGKILSTPISPSLVKYITDSDIIHLHLPNPAAELAYLIARPKGKLIVSYHSDIVRQKKAFLLYKPIFKRILEKADAIIVAAPQMKDSEMLKQFQDKCVVIPYGIDINVKTKAIKQEKPIVLFVGRLVYYKGAEYLIKAMEDIDAELLIVGDGPLKKKLMQISSKPIFLDEVSDEKLDELYNSCSVFVLPSVEKSEAFGIVQLEAMLRGKPVISTELGTGTSFVNIHEKTGFVVKPRDITELKSAIEKVLNNKKLAKKLGVNARARVIKEFSDKLMASRILKVYKNLAI